MGSFFQGLGAGLASGADTALRSVLDQRRTEAVARLSAQLQGEQYSRARGDQVADRGQAIAREDTLRAAANTREDTKSAEATTAADARLDKTLQNAKDVAKIGADGRLAAIEARLQAGGYGGAAGAAGANADKINYVDSTDAKGNPTRLPVSVETRNSRGLPVVIPYGDYIRLQSPPPPPGAAADPAAATAPAAAKAAPPDFASQEEAAAYGRQRGEQRRSEAAAAEAAAAAAKAEADRKGLMRRAAEAAEFGAANPPPAQPPRSSRGMNY